MKTTNHQRQHRDDRPEENNGIDVSRLRVAAEDGSIILTGSVESYLERQVSEWIRHKLSSQKGEVEERDRVLDLDPAANRSDSEIAFAAYAALKDDHSVPESKITIAVRDSWITLEGQLCWPSQKEAASEAVRGLPGVRGISNLITIRE